MKTKLLTIIGVLIICTANILAQGGGKAEPNRIKFAKSKSSATMSGTLSKDEQMEYVFGAKVWQKITLKVVSIPSGNLFSFNLNGADGIEFKTEQDSYADYTFTAPQTGDYLVTVIKNPTRKAARAKFSLTLTIK